MATPEDAMNEKEISLSDEPPDSHKMDSVNHSSESHTISNEELVTSNSDKSYTDDKTKDNKQRSAFRRCSAGQLKRVKIIEDEDLLSRRIRRQESSSPNDADSREEFAKYGDPSSTPIVTVNHNEVVVDFKEEDEWPDVEEDINMLLVTEAIEDATQTAIETHATTNGAVQTTTTTTESFCTAEEQAAALADRRARAKEERKKERDKKKEEYMLKKFQMEQEAKQTASAKSKCGRWIKHNLKIGEGGYKFVYRGYDRTGALNVAWCEFKREHVDTKEKRQAMFRETEIMLKMDHPHIVQCFDVFRDWINVENPNNSLDEKGLVIIQELMGEGTLKSVIRKNFQEGRCILKFPLITRWWHQILDALNYMHTKMDPPIIHRDLKAENCFVCGLSDEEYLNVKVGDFGLATHVNTSGRKTMLGTLGFMAPEIFDEQYEESVDIYAFGMLMLEVMTNRTPYDECETVIQVAAKTMTGRGPKVLEMVEDSNLREVIEACIHPLACYRPTASELMHNTLFQIKPHAVEVEPNYDKESDREEVITRYIRSLDAETKDPNFNLRLRFRDKRMLQELGLDDGESLEFDLDIYKADSQDITDLITNLRIEFEDKLSRVFENPKLPETRKNVTLQMDRLFQSIRIQMQFLVKVLLGRRWHTLLASLAETGEDDMDAEDKAGMSNFTMISVFKNKWIKAKRMLDLEVKNYLKPAESSPPAVAPSVPSTPQVTAPPPPVTTTAQQQAPLVKPAVVAAAVQSSTLLVKQATLQGMESTGSHIQSGMALFNTINGPVAFSHGYHNTMTTGPYVPLGQIQTHSQPGSNIFQQPMNMQAPRPPYMYPQQQQQMNQPSSNIYHQVHNPQQGQPIPNVYQPPSSQGSSVFQIPQAAQQQSQLIMNQQTQQLTNQQTQLNQMLPQQPIPGNVYPVMSQSQPIKILQQQQQVKQPSPPQQQQAPIGSSQNFFSATGTGYSTTPTVSVQQPLTQTFQTTAPLPSPLATTMVNVKVTPTSTVVLPQQAIPNLLAAPYFSHPPTIPFLRAEDVLVNRELESSAGYFNETEPASNCGQQCYPQQTSNTVQMAESGTVKPSSRKSRLDPNFGGYPSTINLPYNNYPMSNSPIDMLQHNQLPMYPLSSLPAHMLNTPRAKSPDCNRRYRSASLYTAAGYHSQYDHVVHGDSAGSVQDQPVKAQKGRSVSLLEGPCSLRTSAQSGVCYQPPLAMPPFPYYPSGLDTSLASAEQVRRTRSQNSLASRPSVKTERKAKKKSRPKGKYLLRITDMQEGSDAGTLRLTFYMQVPADRSNTRAPGTWKLTFQCNLSDKTEDFSIPVFDAEVDRALKETVTMMLKSLHEDINSVKLNEDYIFFPVPTHLGQATLELSNQTAAAEFCGSGQISTEDDTFSQISSATDGNLDTINGSGVVSNPTLPLSVDHLTTFTAQQKSPLWEAASLPPSVGVSRQPSLEEMRVEETPAVKEDAVVPIVSDAETVAVPDSTVPVLPLPTSEVFSSPVKPTFLATLNSELGSPVLPPGSPSKKGFIDRVTMQAVLRGLQTPDSCTSSPDSGSYVTACEDTDSAPGGGLSLVSIPEVPNGFTLLEETKCAADRLMEDTVEGSLQNDSMITIELSVPNGLEDVIRDIASRLQKNCHRTLVLVPHNEAKVTGPIDQNGAEGGSERSPSSPQKQQQQQSQPMCKVPRIHEVPEQNIFIGVPKKSNSGMSIIKGPKEKSFVVAQESGMDGQSNPRIYQAPAEGAVILTPTGEIQYVERPTVVMPPYPPHSRQVRVQELPLSVTTASDSNMSFDDVIELMQTLKGMMREKTDSERCASSVEAQPYVLHSSQSDSVPTTKAAKKEDKAVVQPPLVEASQPQPVFLQVGIPVDATNTQPANVSPLNTSCATSTTSAGVLSQQPQQQNQQPQSEVHQVHGYQHPQYYQHPQFANQYRPLVQLPPFYFPPTTRVNPSSLYHAPMPPGFQFQTPVFPTITALPPHQFPGQQGPPPALTAVASSNAFYQPINPIEQGFYQQQRQQQHPQEHQLPTTHVSMEACSTPLYQLSQQQSSLVNGRGSLVEPTSLVNVVPATLAFGRFVVEAVHSSEQQSSLAVQSGSASEKNTNDNATASKNVGRFLVTQAVSSSSSISDRSVVEGKESGDVRDVPASST